MTRNNPELPIHMAILHYLQAVLPRESADTLTHVPNGEKRPARTGALLKRMGVIRGVEDLQFIWKGRLCAIEVKPEGAYLSPVQRERRDAVWAAGGNYAVCRSTLDVRDILAEWDVPTKEIT